MGTPLRGVDNSLNLRTIIRHVAPCFSALRRGEVFADGST